MASHPVVALIVAAMLHCSGRVGAVTGSTPCTCDTVHNPTQDCALKYVRQGDTEWSGVEIANENGEKTLLCEVENFCDLQWFDEDVDERIEADADPDYIKLQDFNQKLVFRQSRLGVDDGLYKCAPSQGSHVLEPRFIRLQIKPENSGMVFILSHENCQANMADTGDTATFYCEFSTSQKPDFLDVTWGLFNESTNETVLVDYLNDYVNKDDPEVTTHYETIVFVDPNEGRRSDEFWIYNTSLIIHNISREAFGRYRIEVLANLNKKDFHFVVLSENPKRPVDPFNGLLIVGATVAAVLAAVTLVGITYYNTRLEMKLYWKDNYSNDCKHDGKESDAYISYSHAGGQSEEDLNFVVNVLKVELERRGYVVIIRDIDHIPGTMIHDEIVQSLETCRRCIMVVSPDYLTSWVGDYDIRVMMDRLGVDYKNHLIPIMFRNVSVEKLAMNEHKLLKYILDNVPCLTWPNGGSESVDGGKATSGSAEAGHVCNIPSSGECYVANGSNVTCSDVEGSKGHSDDVENKDHISSSKKSAKRYQNFVKELLLRMPPRRFTLQNVAAKSGEGDVVGVSLKMTGVAATSQLQLFGEYEQQPSLTTPPVISVHHEQNGGSSVPFTPAFTSSLYPKLESCIDSSSHSNNIVI